MTLILSFLLQEDFPDAALAKLETLHMCVCVCVCVITFQAFLGSSAGKESACNAGDPGLISVLGSSAGEGIGYPLQYCWASLVAQMVKNPPAMQETWV